MRILVRQVIRQTDAAHTSVDPSKEDRRKKERKMMMMMWRRREAGRKKIMIFFGMGRRFPFHRNAQTGKKCPAASTHTHQKSFF
jgi:hypothetical protein